MQPNVNRIANEAISAASWHKTRFTDSLRKAKKPEDFEHAWADVHHLVDDTIARRLSESGDTIACKSGCSLCCLIKVDALPIEVFFVVEYLKKKVPAETVDTIHARAKAKRRKFAPLTAEQQVETVMPCPLLVEDKCISYSARPLMCRKHHSADRTVCECILTEPGKEVRRPEVLELTYSVPPLVIAMQDAMTEQGFDSDPYDFAAALDEALSNPKCYKRWRDKKAAFGKEIVAKDWRK